MLALIAQRGLSASGYKAMLEPQAKVPVDEGARPGWPTRFGLGFQLMNSPFRLAYGHGGNNGDFTSLFEVYPEHQAGFVVFTNGDAGTTLISDLREYLVIGGASQDVSARD